VVAGAGRGSTVRGAVTFAPSGLTMAVIYVAHPLDHEIAHWLATHGVTCPTGRTGRHPTAAEVRAALGEIDDVRYHQGPDTDGAGWLIDVMHRADPRNGRWTSIRSSAQRDERAAIAFHKGWLELIIEITHRLSARVGPLVLIPDTGGTPLPVWAGRSLAETLAAFVVEQGA